MLNKKELLAVTVELGEIFSRIYDCEIYESIAVDGYAIHACAQNVYSVTLQRNSTITVTMLDMPLSMVQYLLDRHWVLSMCNDRWTLYFSHFDPDVWYMALADLAYTVRRDDIFTMDGDIINRVWF